MGPRDVLDRYGKSRPFRDSIPGPSSSQPVAIPTELPGPHIYMRFYVTGALNVKMTLFET